MSGPWDRPSPQNPDDREPSWPAADIESPSHQSPSEPWSAEDPWQERRDSSAWDAWPPADDATYQPDLPTSDPWAESWADDEAPAAPSEPASEPIRSGEAPSTEAPAFEPRQPEPPAYEPPPPEPPAYEPPAYEPPAYEPPAYEPPAYEPPAYEPPASEAPAYEQPAPEPQAYEPPGYAPPVYEAPTSDGVAPEPVLDEAPEIVAPPHAAEPEREPEPELEPEPPELEPEPPAPFASAAATPEAPPEVAAPHIEPWSQEADPWGMGADAWPPVVPSEAATEPPEPVTAEPAAEGSVSEAAAAEPLVSDMEQQAGVPVAAEAEATDEVPVEAAAVEPVPATEAERLPDGESQPAEPVVAEAEPAEPGPAEPTPAEPAIAAAAIVEPPLPVEAERMEDETAAVESLADEVDADEPAPDWVAAPGPIFGTAAAAHAVGPASAAEAVVPAEPEVEAEPSPMEEPEPSVETAAEEPDAGDRLAGAGLAALAAGAMAAPEPAPTPPSPEPEERHEPPWAAALFGDEPPETVEPEIPAAAAPSSRAEPIDEVWSPEADLDGLPPVGDHTQVYPSDWTPPPVSAREGQGELEPASATVRTSLADPEAGEEPSTAEQAVPWLIGLILLLAGMVIVLLALIFAGDASLGGAAVLPSGSGDPSPSLMVGALTSPSAAASRSPAPSAASTATPDPVPQYGALEMVYQGRAAALAPIYLLQRDFTIDEDPAVLAQDANLDVHRHAWSPDGRVGAGLLSDVLVSIEPGKEKRRLGDGISALTFGDDATTVYAVRVTEDGGNDVASVLAINFANGDTDELASVSYARPDLTDETALEEAQFLDDGGSIRIFWMDDDTLLLYSTGAGTWTLDPASGEATKLEGHLPQLWSADGHHHITITDKDGTSTLALSNGAGAQLATTTIKGLVSHLRWSPDGERVVFTLGRSASGGGVLQDLYLWDLKDGQAPMQVTSTGAAFGAEWLGTAPRWAAG